MAGEPTLLLTCLQPTGIAAAGGATQDGFYVPEPPSHVEEPCVGGRGRELPEHGHIGLAQGVALDIATRAQVLVQGPNPGRLVTNAQDGPVVGSCNDRGTRRQSGAACHPLPDVRHPQRGHPQRQAAAWGRARGRGEQCLMGSPCGEKGVFWNWTEAGVAWY